MFTSRDPSVAARTVADIAFGDPRHVTDRPDVCRVSATERETAFNDLINRVARITSIAQDRGAQMGATAERLRDCADRLLGAEPPAEVQTGEGSSGKLLREPVSEMARLNDRLNILEDAVADLIEPIGLAAHQTQRFEGVA